MPKWWALMAIAGVACSSAPPAAVGADTGTAVAETSPIDSAETATADSSLAAEATTVTDFVATAADFDCIKNGTGVGHYYVANKLGHLDAAVAVAKGGVKGSTFPIGTIIRLFANEAMVKRGGIGFVATGGWEMFLLKNDGKTMTIDKRGGAEVSNTAGSCFGCHAPAKDYDYVCGADHGCAPLGVTEEIVKALQSIDPNCAK